MAAVPDSNPNPNPNWACLPKNILSSILAKLVPLPDFVRFGAVCKPWLSVAADHKRQRAVSSSKKGFPQLLVTDPPENTLPFRRLSCGSSHGWVATTDRNLVISLSKPLNPGRPAITLPPLGRQEVFGFPFWFDYIMRKVVLSDDPDLFPDSYEVVVVFGMCRSLAYLKSGDKDWIFRTNGEVGDGVFLFSDVIWRNGKLHASEMGLSCGLLCFEVVEDEGGSKRLVSSEVVGRRGFEEGASRRKRRFDRHKSYLVESSCGRDLFLVQRFLETEERGKGKGKDGKDARPMTVDFKVSKLGCDKEGFSRWVEVDGIGDDVFFLGDNHSMAISSLDYEDSDRNCIYYTDDETDVLLYTPRRDMGVFYLDDASIEKLDPDQDNMPPPVWILRNLDSA